MGIVSRIINITKANKNSSNFTKNEFEKNDFLLNEDDDELKQIIEELNQNNKTCEIPKYENHSATKTQTAAPQKVLDAFAVLGVNEFNNKTEIAEAFKSKLKMYHPDKHQNSSNEEFLARKTAELIEAYSIIKNYKKY